MLCVGCWGIEEMHEKVKRGDGVSGLVYCIYAHMLMEKEEVAFMSGENTGNRKRRATATAAVAGPIFGSYNYTSSSLTHTHVNTHNSAGGTVFASAAVCARE